MVNEDVTVLLPCPGCGEKTRKTIRWFKTNPDSFVCSGCGETVHLDPEDVAQLLSVFDHVDERIADVERSIEVLNKRMKGL